MLGALTGALMAAGIIFMVLMLWVGVQGLFRKSENLPPDCDVIGDTGRGCGHCNLRETCDLRQDHDAT